MMYAMEQEVQHQEEGTIRQPCVDVKQESVQKVLEQGPNDIPNKEGYQRLAKCGWRDCENGRRGVRGRLKHGFGGSVGEL